jgi:hypothetical protein
MGALSAERQTLEEKETQLRNLVGEAEAKRGWFEDMSSKTEDLGAFLDAKVVFLVPSGSYILKGAFSVPSPGRYRKRSLILHPRARYHGLETITLGRCRRSFRLFRSTKFA